MTLIFELPDDLAARWESVSHLALRLAGEIEPPRGRD
jgi:hypothetical protein